MDGAAGRVAVDNTPAGYHARNDDQPDFPMGGRARGIAYRGFGLAIGVAVIMTDNLLPQAPGLPMGPQQRGRIDFETARWVDGNIKCRHCGGDLSRPAEQKPAAFAGTGSGSFGQQGFAYPACNFHDHADID